MNASSLPGRRGRQGRRRRAGKAAHPAAERPEFHLLDASRPLPEEPFIGLVPGEEVLVLEVELPPRLRGAARLRVARRQVADLLDSGSDPRDLEIHPFPGDGASGTWDTVLVADRARLDELRRRMAKAGAPCRAILPDYLALPAAPGIWTVDADDHRCRVRTGLRSGFTLEPDLAGRALTAALAAAAEADEQPRAVLRLGSAQSDIDAALGRFDHIPVVSDTDAELPGGGWARQLCHGELSADMAEDAQLAAERLKREVMRWVPALSLALIALVAWVIAIEIDIRALEDRAAAERRLAEESLRDRMLRGGPIVDMRSQVAQRLEAARRDAGDEGTGPPPLDVLRRAAPLIIEAGGDVRRATLRPGDGLRVVVRVGDFAGLDTLNASLSGAGIGVEVSGSRALDPTGVEATLRLGAAIDN